MGTASIHSLELGCCTRKPEPWGFACAAAKAGGPTAGPSDAAHAADTCGAEGACCALSGCGLIGLLPNKPTVGSRMDCEAFESIVTAEPECAPLPPGKALSHDLTCISVRIHQQEFVTYIPKCTGHAQT